MKTKTLCDIVSSLGAFAMLAGCGNPQARPSKSGRENHEDSPYKMIVIDPTKSGMDYSGKIIVPPKNIDPQMEHKLPPEQYRTFYRKP